MCVCVCVSAAVVPRMLDAIAGYTVKRIRARNVAAVSKPADIAAMLHAYADLNHVSVVSAHTHTHICMDSFLFRRFAVPTSHPGLGRQCTAGPVVLCSTCVEVCVCVCVSSCPQAIPELVQWTATQLAQDLASEYSAAATRLAATQTHKPNSIGSKTDNASMVSLLSTSLTPTLVLDLLTAYRRLGHYPGETRVLSLLAPLLPQVCVCVCVCDYHMLYATYALCISVLDFYA